MFFVQYRVVSKEARAKTRAYKPLAPLRSGVDYFLFLFGMPLASLEHLGDANCIENQVIVQIFCSEAYCALRAA